MRHRLKLFGLLALGVSVWPLLDAAPMTAAFSTTRTISFFHIHTKETISVTYKKDGRYVSDAMDKIDWIMRDWRRNEKTKMDPETIDILWEMHAELGSKEPIHIICGFRSRSTNEMLRRTVGGQASESQHITGKAIDVTFPDVPLKQIRYAALVRQQGGVGYYPTSGIPFVHVDTGRVRHWPRLPRYELALLFPNGQSKHHPADGGDITLEDVRVAQSRHKDLATQIAGYFNLRTQARDGAPIALADASGSSRSKPDRTAPVPAPAPVPVAAAAKQPAAPARPAGSIDVAALIDPAPRAAAPKLLLEPQLVERPSRLKPAVSDADRSKLASLVSFAANDPALPRLVSGPEPAQRRANSGPRADAASPAPRLELAALTTETANSLSDAARILSDAGRNGWGNGWIAAPGFDDDHPEELSYRPFPLGPLLTADASINDPVMARLTAPDIPRVLETLAEPAAVPPLRFRPGRQVAEVMWAQEFKGESVQLADAAFDGGPEDLPTRLMPRSVKTAASE